MIRSVESIKRAFPNPISVPSKIERQKRPPEQLYCVGGAFMMCMQSGYPSLGGFGGAFPHSSELALALHKYLHLPLELAATFAASITNQNDLGHFEAAWKQLEMAYEAGGFPYNI